jgi:RNA polymerase sigma-70 factor, ECF subfamily
VTSDASDTSSSTSLSLLDRARGQEPEAWERLTRVYAPLVYGWARHAGLQANEAADVVQEVFASVLANLERFRHDQPGSSFRGWLWTITRNQVRLHYRREMARPEVTGGTAHQQQIEQHPDPVDDEHDPSSSDQSKSLLHRTLRMVRDDFEDNTWNSFWRLTVEGHTAADIAADLGMTSQAVRQAKYRVLSRLRRELADM